MLDAQYSPDDLADAPEARDDDGVAGLVDAIEGRRLKRVEARLDHLFVEQHQQRRRGHAHADDQYQTVGEPLADDAVGGGRGEQYEAELTALRQDKCEVARTAHRQSEGAPKAVEHDELDGEQREHQRQDLNRLGAQQSEIDGHADRHEEQPHEQTLERLDVGLDLVPILGVGQQHAGDECPERHRQTGHLHDQRRDDHHHEAGGGEDLVTAGGGHHAEYRTQQVMSADHEDDDADHAGRDVLRDHVVRQRLSTVGEQRQQSQHRDHGKVLEQQDREGGAPVDGVDLLLLRKQLDGEGRRGQREPEADDGGSRGRKADDHADRRDYRRGGEHLGQTHAEDRSAQYPQTRGPQLQADQKQQQHDTELGEVKDVLDAGDETETPRPDHHAGHQVTEYGPEAEAVEQGHRADRRGEKDRRLLCE